MQALIIAIFILGYTAIVFEHNLKVNKAGTALVMGILCWTVYILFAPGGYESVLHQVNEQMSDISGILFFLLGAMAIVEVIDSHDGFRFITDRIKSTNKRRLLWIITFIAFFLSAILDNLTTTIIMISLLGKLLGDTKDRLIFSSMIVIAANSGGAWTPIGDVTTTMLWIGGQVSTVGVIKELFLPSLVSTLVPLAIFSVRMNGNAAPPAGKRKKRRGLRLPPALRNSIFFLGVLILLFVPVFKTLTHLPPFAGMMLGLGFLWIYTGILYRRHRGSPLKKNHLSVTSALHQIDFSTILFFLGILLCVGALQHTGILSSLAGWLERTVGNQSLTVTIIGLISAVVDNVPLVAAAQGMYDFPVDHFFWKFLAYAAGTGGSILIIGSAAGVAAMGLQKIDFIWYLKRISPWALLGYLAGVATFIVGSKILG